MTHLNIVQVFVHGCLFTDSFQEESRKELKDDNYTEFSRGLSGLHLRALLVVKMMTKVVTRVVNIFELSHSHNLYQQTIIVSNLSAKR